MKKLLFIALTTISFTSISQNFQWAKGIGDAAYDHCRSMKTDSHGNIYVTGSFQGTVDFDPGPSLHYLVSAGIYDVYVLKLDPSGNFLWAKSMGGPSTDEGFSIAIDSSGNVYTTGTLQGSGDFNPGSATYTLSAISQFAYTAFISKLDGNGNFVWAKNFPLGETKGESITVDLVGNVYSVGKIYSTSDFDPGPSSYTLAGYNSNLYISKLNSSGSFVWAKSTNATNYNESFSLALDDFNNLYIHGSFTGTADFNTGTGVDSYSSLGFQDAFILKLDTAGNYKWTKTLSGSNTCYGISIATDADGNLYTIGNYYPTVDFDPGVNTYSLSATGFGDLYVLKLDSTGALMWARSTQGIYSAFNASNVFSRCLALDSQNSIYVTGFFTGRVDFNTDASSSDSLDSYSGNYSFILKLNSNGNFQWVKSIGANNSNSIAIDHNDNMILAGDYTGSGDFDPTPSVYTLTSNGVNDFFISKTGSSIISVKEFLNNTALPIFPNPNNGNFNIVVKEKTKLTIIDNLGRIIQSIELNARNDFQQNIHVLSSGIYFVSGQSNNGSFNQKIVVTQ